MKGFVLGLLVAALAFAGYLHWGSGRLFGPETSQPAATAGPDAAAPAKKRRRVRRTARAGERRVQPGGEWNDPAAVLEPEPEPVRLAPSDLRIVGQGDDLGRPEVVRMDFGEAGDVRELSQDDIDARFRPEEPAILDCIAEARPDAETYVPGRVTIKFRIQRDGTVRGVRVEAPAILHRAGLFGCVRGVVGRLRFPASGSGQIVSYPFTLS